MPKEKICPRVGTACLEHECLFYQQVPARPEEFICEDRLNTLVLMDIANQLNLLLRSSEQNRETSTQALKSRLIGNMTPELKRLLGFENAD